MSELPPVALSRHHTRTAYHLRPRPAELLLQTRTNLDFAGVLTSRDTEKALDRTLAGQREQLDRTLAEQRPRTLNERFATATEQLGSDKPPAVRLAGVYATAGLADDWEENRQTCTDVLCGYLRMPYEPDPGAEAPAEKRLAFEASREVRHTVIRVITAHLKDGAAVSWQGLNFDFTRVVFDGGDFSEAKFSGGIVSFSGAEFSGGEVSLHGTKFCGADVSFDGAQFSGAEVKRHRRGLCGQFQRHMLKPGRDNRAPGTPAAGSVT